jgi:hypothetical protein
MFQPAPLVAPMLPPAPIDGPILDLPAILERSPSPLEHERRPPVPLLACRSSPLERGAAVMNRPEPSPAASLQPFTTTKVLNCRQARWAEHLSTFDFQIVYRKGTSNGKRDALSRRAELRPQEGGTTAAGTSAPFLKPEQYIEIAGYEQAGGSDDKICREFGKIILASLDKVRFSSEFLDKIRQATANDEEYATMKTKCAAQNTESIAPHYTLDDDVLYYKHRLVVPAALRKTVLEAEHDSKVAGHWGANHALYARLYHRMDPRLLELGVKPMANTLWWLICNPVGSW